MPLTAWPTITSADYSHGAPLTTTMALKFRSALLHLKQVGYGDGSYTGDYPHDHDGAEDAAIVAAHTSNLLNDFCPDSGAVAAWTRSGYTVENDNGFRTTTTANHYAYQILLRSAASSKAAIGSGADLTLSIWVRALADVPTAGELHFGIADGGVAFKANCKGVIAAASIGAHPKRFYMQLSAATIGTPTTDLRFIVKNHSTPPNQELFVTALDCRIGHVLAHAEPGILESESKHDDWKQYGLTDTPMIETDGGILNATAVTGA